MATKYDRRSWLPTPERPGLTQAKAHLLDAEEASARGKQGRRSEAVQDAIRELTLVSAEVLLQRSLGLPH